MPGGRTRARMLECGDPDRLIRYPGNTAYIRKAPRARARRPSKPWLQRTDDDMTDNILVERDDSIVTVTLNRPEKLNALSYEMYDKLGQAFEAISADDSVRCVVVRGAGGRAFSAGADIGEFGTGRAGREQAREYGECALRACA